MKPTALFWIVLFFSQFVCLICANMNKNLNLNLKFLYPVVSSALQRRQPWRGAIGALSPASHPLCTFQGLLTLKKKTLNFLTSLCQIISHMQGRSSALCWQGFPISVMRIEMALSPFWLIPLTLNKLCTNSLSLSLSLGLSISLERDFLPPAWRHHGVEKCNQKISRSGQSAIRLPDEITKKNLSKVGTCGGGGEEGRGGQTEDSADC